MVMVSNLPSLPTPVAPATDVAIVSRDNTLFKMTFQDFFDQSVLNINPALIDHDLLANVDPNQHIDWTNATANFLTTGTVNGGALSGTNTGDQNLFDTFKVLGLLPSTNIVATTPADCFTFVPGPNVDLTTNPATKELFISVTGGSGSSLEVGVTVDNYDPDGILDTFALSTAPASEDYVIAFTDGVYQGNAQYTVTTSPDEIIFGTPPLAAINNLTLYTYDDPDLVLNTDEYTEGVDFTTGGTALTLNVAPADEDHILVFFEGSFEGTPHYGVSGTTLTFTDPIPAGVNKIEVVTFIDAGVSASDVNINREVYLDTVNFTAGTTDLLVLPTTVFKKEETIVFFDGAHISPSSYTVNAQVIQFSAPIPATTAKVEIVTVTGALTGVESPNSFGTIKVSGEPDVVAEVPSDTVTFIAGSGISITTDAILDTVTFNGSNIQTVVNVGALPATIGATDDTTNVTVTGGSIFLPLAPVNGQTHSVRKDAAGPPLTLDGNGNLINGSATFGITGTLTTVKVQFNSGTGEWMII